MKTMEWVENVKTGGQAWVVKRYDNWDKVEVMYAGKKTYWLIRNTVSV